MLLCMIFLHFHFIIFIVVFDGARLLTKASDVVECSPQQLELLRGGGGVVGGAESPTVLAALRGEEGGGRRVNAAQTDLVEVFGTFYCNKQQRLKFFYFCPVVYYITNVSVDEK